MTASQVSVCPAGGSGGCLSPASNLSTAAFSLPAQGVFDLSVKLVDAAGNVTVAPAVTQVGYDSGAPPAPGLGPVESGGGDAYRIAIDTSNDPGPAPIASLVGEACPAEGGACQPISASLDHASFRLPSPGQWTISARAVDAAGNTSPSKSTAYTVTAAVETPSPTATASATPTSEPTAAPTTTPTIRTKPKLTFATARLTRTRVVIRGKIGRRNATGRVRITVRARHRTVVKSTKVRRGAFAAKITLKPRQRGARHASVSVRYGGDANYAPRLQTRRLSRARR